MRPLLSPILAAAVWAGLGSTVLADCEAGVDGCVSCLDGADNLCLRCEYGYEKRRLLSGTIVTCRSCGPNTSDTVYYSQPGDFCVENLCSTAYTYPGWGEPLMEGCETCTDGTTCTGCAAGFVLSGDKCSECSPSSEAAPGSYFVSGTCTQQTCDSAIADCQDCSDAATCLECGPLAAGHYFVDFPASCDQATCASAHGASCLACDDTIDCDECAYGFEDKYVSNRRTCVECTSNNPSFYLPLAAAGTCDVELCKNAMPKCRECSDATSCTLCEGERNHRLKVTNNHGPKSDGTPGCEACPNLQAGSYFLAPGSCDVATCSSAMSGCDDCFNAERCTSCGVGFKAAPMHWSDQQETGVWSPGCDACDPVRNGYYYTAGSCTERYCGTSMANCGACLSATVCTECDLGYTLSNPSTCTECPNAQRPTAGYEYFRSDSDCSVRKREDLTGRYYSSDASPSTSLACTNAPGLGRKYTAGWTTDATACPTTECPESLATGYEWQDTTGTCVQIKCTSALPAGTYYVSDPVEVCKTAGPCTNVPSVNYEYVTGWADSATSCAYAWCGNSNVPNGYMYPAGRNGESCDDVIKCPEPTLGFYYAGRSVVGSYNRCLERPCEFQPGTQPMLGWSDNVRQCPTKSCPSIPALGREYGPTSEWTWTTYDANDICPTVSCAPPSSSAFSPGTYYWESGQVCVPASCSDAIDNCVACDDPTTCSQCGLGYASAASGGGCTPCAEADALPGHYWATPGACGPSNQQACPDNCAQCSSTGCDECSFGFYNLNGVRCENCLPVTYQGTDDSESWVRVTGDATSCSYERCDAIMDGCATCDADRTEWDTPFVCNACHLGWIPSLTDAGDIIESCEESEDSQSEDALAALAALVSNPTILGAMIGGVVLVIAIVVIICCCCCCTCCKGSDSRDDKLELEARQYETIDDNYKVETGYANNGP